MAEETPTVYLHKVNVNPKSKAVTVIVTDEPLQAQSAGKGLKIGNTTYVSTHKRQQVNFGVLVLKGTGKLGKLLKAKPEHVRKLQEDAKKNPGKPIPNFEFSDHPVMGENGKQVGNLVWVVDAE